MFLVADKMRVGVVTNHLPLSQVPSALTTEMISEQALSDGRLAQEGFRHHPPEDSRAGSESSFGRRRNARPRGDRDYQSGHRGGWAGELSWRSGPIRLTGFFSTHQQYNFDAVLAMYHDPGTDSVQGSGLRYGSQLHRRPAGSAHGPGPRYGIRAGRKGYGQSYAHEVSDIRGYRHRPQPLELRSE